MLGNDEVIDWAERDGAIRTDYGYMLQNPLDTKDPEYGVWEQVVSTLLLDDRYRLECEKAVKEYVKSHDISILEKSWAKLFR